MHTCMHGIQVTQQLKESGRPSGIRRAAVCLLSFHAGLHKSNIVQDDFQETETSMGLFCSSPQTDWEIYLL